MSEIEKQAIITLIYLRNISESKGYVFSEKDILQDLIADVFEKKNISVFFNTERKPLKKQASILQYLEKKKYIDKNSNTYTITSEGLEKVYDIENIHVSFKKIFSTIGTIGGFFYISLSIVKIIASFIISKHNFLTWFTLK